MDTTLRFASNSTAGGPVVFRLALVFALAAVYATPAPGCDTALIQQHLGHLAKLGQTAPHHHNLKHATAQAGPFAADGVEMLCHIPVGDVPGGHSAGTDIWGYVSPSGREYAILGLSQGTAFIEVTDPANPVIVDVIPHINACCSDAKTYQHYAYIVSEGDNIGMKIVDLAQIDSGIVTELPTYTGGALKQAHNLAIDAASGFAYICGALDNPALGGLMVLDLREPTDPQLKGFWSDQYVHDAQVVTYESGPYAGKQIAFAFSGFFTSRLRIIDVTNKSDMRVIGVADYPNASFAHQGWLSDDRRYVYLNDEFDELDHGVSTSTHMIDVTDLRNPTYVRSFGSGLASTDHNLTVRGKFVFEANYTSGLRVFRVDSLARITEVGYFDTHPQNDDTGFNGAWGVYAGLPSGNLLVSDIQQGLFVLDPSGALAKPTPLLPTATLAGLGALAVGLAAGGLVAARRTRRRHRYGA